MLSNQNPVKFLPKTELVDVHWPALSVVPVAATPNAATRYQHRIGVIGLGYVGLPVAAAFAEHYDVIGYDIDVERVARLLVKYDATGEVSPQKLSQESLTITSDASSLADVDLYIVTVPTPVDGSRRPDFSILYAACAVIGPNLNKGDVVVFESTVYPGATEEICGPALEEASGLICGVDFKLGYSPERINPGDRERPIEKIVKIVSGQDAETLATVATAYEAIITAGIHRAPSIKIAEAAKVLENTQRDVNIALMNELSKICDLLGIRTKDVLQAAGTKWNFLKFYPGLVGGHCIGVDPYYLTAKAEQMGYHPEVILSGRRINDSMGSYVGRRTVRVLSTSGCRLPEARVGVFGMTFKENVPDIRNSKVIDIADELVAHGIMPMVHDPLASVAATKHEYGIDLMALDDLWDLDALILAVEHDFYCEMELSSVLDRIRPGGLLIDVKSRIDPALVREDIQYWSL